MAAASLSSLPEDRYATAQTGAWVQGAYRYSDQENDAPSSTTLFDNGYNANSYTFAVGYDHALDDQTIVGVTGSFSEVNIDANRDANSSSNLDIFQIGVYGSRQFGQLNVSGQASYVAGEGDTQRAAFETITGNFDIDGFNIGALASYDFEFGDYYVAPLLGLQYSSIDTDGLTESGGLNIQVEDSNTDFIEGRAGATFGVRQELSQSIADFYLTVAAINDFGGGPDDITLSFANQSTTLTQLDTNDLRGQAIAGVNWYSGETLTIGGTINGELANDFTSIGGSIRAKFNF